MSEPLTWAGAALTKYGPTVAGLAIGTAAKYGLALNEGRPLTWRGVLADLLLLGILGLLAIAISELVAQVTRTPIGTDFRVLIGSLAAVSSDRLVRLARDRFIDRVGANLTAAIDPTDLPS